MPTTSAATASEKEGTSPLGGAGDDDAPSLPLASPTMNSTRALVRPRCDSPVGDARSTDGAPPEDAVRSMSAEPARDDETTAADTTRGARASAASASIVHTAREARLEADTRRAAALRDARRTQTKMQQPRPPTHGAATPTMMGTGAAARGGSTLGGGDGGDGGGGGGGGGAGDGGGSSPGTATTPPVTPTDASRASQAWSPVAAAPGEAASSA